MNLLSSFPWPPVLRGSAFTPILSAALSMSTKRSDVPNYDRNHWASQPPMGRRNRSVFVNTVLERWCYGNTDRGGLGCGTVGLGLARLAELVSAPQTETNKTTNSYVARGSSCFRGRLCRRYQLCATLIRARAFGVAPPGRSAWPASSC
jgi:hypothetical protein